MDNKGIHSVPPTTYVELGHSFFENKDQIAVNPSSITHPQISMENEFLNKKEGSLQLYVTHNDMVGDYGPSMFNTKEVQKIAILDLRIINCDRNEENILVRK